MVMHTYSSSSGLKTTERSRRQRNRKEEKSHVENFNRQARNNMYGWTSLGKITKTVKNAVHREAKRHVEDFM